MKVEVRLADEGGTVVLNAPMTTYVSDGDGDLHVRCMDERGNPVAGSALYARGAWVGVRVAELPGGDLRIKVDKLQREAEDDA